MTSSKDFGGTLFTRTKPAQTLAWNLFQVVLRKTVAHYGIERSVQSRDLRDWLQLVGTWLIPLVVLGATIFWNQRQRAAERREQERYLQRAFHKDLSQAYNTGKKVRRLLRVQNRRGGIKQQAPPYDKLMEELVTTQLQFELLKEETPIRFRDGVVGSDIYSQLKIVENYLGKIVSEYEKGNSKFPLLREFIDNDKKGLGFKKWRASYQLPAHNGSKLVLEYLTNDKGAAEQTVEVDVGLGRGGYVLLS